MSRKLARFTATLVVASCFFWISPIDVEARTRPSPRPDVQQLIDRIKASHSSEQQEKLAFRLCRDVKLGFFEHYSDREIDQISDLLNSEDDLVVLWSAWSLAAIGPKARRAAPVLQKAELKWQSYYCVDPALPTRHTLGAVVGAILDLHIELNRTTCPSRPGPSDGPAQLSWPHSTRVGEPATFPPGPEIQKLIDQIKDNHSANQKGEFSFHLWREVKSGFFVRYPDVEIDQISDFLKSEDGPVVYWSVWTLAAIGPDARRAAPVLRATELKWECKFRAHQDSRTERIVRLLVVTMQDFKLEPLPADCPWGPAPSGVSAQAP